MSKLISEMLGQPEREVKKLINALEAKNGYPSHDVRLLANNIQRVRTKITDLKLDPDDTTAQELYQALLIKFQNDSRRFDEHFGVASEDSAQKVGKAVGIVTQNIDMPDKWLLKCSFAKQLLRRQPPKKLMKQLGYRSVDSMLKREDIAKVYLASNLIESAVWQRAQAILISTLDSTAFERRKLKIVELSGNYQTILPPQTTSIYNSEYGVIGITQSWPSTTPLLSMVVCLLDRLADHSDINLSLIASSFSPAAAWWADMDYLIFCLNSQFVSLNIKDVADNLLLNQEFGASYHAAAQKSLWKELLSRYENQLMPDEDYLPTVVNPFKARAPLNQPAFEYVEDI